MSAWQPTADLARLQQRAALLAAIRAFFAARGVLEVETPALSAAATTDPQIESFQCMAQVAGQMRPYYLHTSPEFAMKRLLAAGSGAIYQIARVFRQGERGRYHNPEFTLLEWYRPDVSLTELMAEVAALLLPLLPHFDHSESISYAAAMQRYVGVDPHTASIETLATCCRDHGINPPDLGDDRDGWLALLLSHLIEPQLGQGGGLTFLYDFPASQAALAQIRPGDPPVAERFELYGAGIELANGFHELTDATEQQQRFIADQQQRVQQQRPALPYDTHLIAALQQGLPDSCGVAVGIDRLLLLASGAESLDQVIAFPFDRA